MNKSKILTLSIISLLSIAGLALIPSLVSAQMAKAGLDNGNGKGIGSSQMLKTKAELFGLSEEELRTQLQTKTMSQIAEEKNISLDKIHQAIQAAAKQRWSDRGLSEEEINNRLERMKERQSGDCEANRANRSIRWNS